MISNIIIINYETYNFKFIHVASRVIIIDMYYYYYYDYSDDYDYYDDYYYIYL